MDWKPCFADPTRGVAFFDGITIEADPITDPRRNRVLPILEEEQVFVCRQMSDTLEPGSLVLDVGTGSGVYAIWAAKHGCRVVAIDMSERAIKVARENVKTNAQSHDISLSEVEDSLSPEELHQIEPGDVCLSETTFDENFASNFVSAFDLVILSPPYNPTADNIYPARHASAGINGQRDFEAQVELVPEVLKEGGRCIGNQMTPSKPFHNGRATSPEGEDPTYAIQRIKNVFERDQGCTVRYTPIMGRPEATIGVKTFLKGVYSSYTNSFSEKYSTSLDSQGVENYIDRAVEDAMDKAGCDNPQYALIYYEVEANTEESTVDSLDTRYEVPDADWQDRIRLHRDIIEHTSNPGLIPSHSLFMRHGPVSDFPLSANNGEKEKSEWETSPMYIADRWVSRRNLVSDESSPFDVMLADAAPVYREAMVPLRLREECKAWTLSTQNEDSKGSKTKTEEMRYQLLRQWQFNTQALQKNSVGPLLHPKFVRAESTHKWSGIQCTTLTSSKNNFGFEGRKKYDDLLEEIRKGVDEKRDNEEQEDLEEIDFSKEHGFSRSRLGDLRIPDTSRNNYKYVSDLRNRLNEVDLLGKSPSLGQDLEACHRIMHEQVHDRFEKVLGEKLRWSTLIGIPLSLAFSEGDADSGIEEVPNTYRGGLWVFAGGWSHEYTLEHEETLFDLSRLLWMLYNGKFNAEAIEKSSEVAKHQAATVSGHEAGPQMTLVDTAIPKEGETMTSRAYKLIRGSLRYSRLFLNETADNVPDNWLPWAESNGQGQRLDDWIKRSLSTGWEIAVAREARGIEFRDIDQNEDVWGRLIDFDIEKNTTIRNDLESSRFQSPGRSNEEKSNFLNITPWNVLRWFLTACSNAYKWSRPGISRESESNRPKKMDVLEEWSENIDSLCQVRVSLKKKSSTNGQNVVSLSVSNGCIEPVPENYENKDGGTLDALESMARNMGCKFEHRPLEEEELQNRLGDEEHGFIVTIELPSLIFKE
jgi:16S rRNA G966 N2-methylase RsmD